MQDRNTTSLICRVFDNSTDLDWLSTLSITEWDALILQTRKAKLISRLAYLTDGQAAIDQFPQKVAIHLANATRQSHAHRRSCAFEVRQIHQVLFNADVEFCLLKGAAYLHDDIDAGRGRLFGDIDILVRKTDLARAERALCENQWAPTKIDPYTQNYYRQWSHELPPLHHTRRHSDLDVHHTVVPPIIKTGFDVQRFWDAAIPDSEMPGLFRLADTDRILHSAAHLFQEGEFETGFRDLIDLDSLFRDYLKRGDDWETLLDRAALLHLDQHLWFAIQLCASLLHTPLPDRVLNWQRGDSILEVAQLKGMLRLYEQALLPDHETCRPRFSSTARLLLFVRSHYIRLPLRLLVPHLWRKAFRDDP